MLSLALPGMPAQSQTRRIGFETIMKQQQCGHFWTQNHVIRDREEWEQLWQIVVSRVWFTDSSLAPRHPPLPEVDFTQKMVIAVFMGNQDSSEYDITIAKLADSESALDVIVKSVSPDSSCTGEQVMTQPCHIILTERVDKEVRFNVRQRTKACPLQEFDTGLRPEGS